MSFSEALCTINALAWLGSSFGGDTPSTPLSLSQPKNDQYLNLEGALIFVLSQFLVANGFAGFVFILAHQNRSELAIWDCDAHCGPQKSLAISETKQSNAALRFQGAMERTEWVQSSRVAPSPFSSLS